MDKLVTFGKELVLVDLTALIQLEEADLVYVRSLTAGEKTVLQDLREDGKSLGDHEFTFLGSFRKDGSKRFTAEAAKDLDGRVAAKIAEKVLEVSGLTEKSQKRALGESVASPT